MKMKIFLSQKTKRTAIFGLLGILAGIFVCSGISEQKKSGNLFPWLITANAKDALIEEISQDKTRQTDKVESKNEQSETERLKTGSLRAKLSENNNSSSEKNADDLRIVPLFDEKSAEGKPLTLKALSKTQGIWVSSDRKTVVLTGKICLKEGLLELFACKKGSKEHESIIVFDILPQLIHAGLLVIGANPGKPAQYQPKFVPPSGDEIDIFVRWKDKNGKIIEKKAQDLILESESKKKMQAPFVFTGGLFGTNPDTGKRYYLADVSGEIFGVSNFPGSILDVPFESTTSNENLYFVPNADQIPDVQTEVTVLLKCAPKKADAAENVPDSESEKTEKQ